MPHLFPSRTAFLVTFLQFGFQPQPGETMEEEHRRENEEHADTDADTPQSSFAVVLGENVRGPTFFTTILLPCNIFFVAKDLHLLRLKFMLFCRSGQVLMLLWVCRQHKEGLSFNPDSFIDVQLVIS